MTPTFRREVLSEIDRLESRVKRLHQFLQEMEGDLPEDHDADTSTMALAASAPSLQEDQQVTQGSTPEAYAPSSKRTSRPDERQLLDMLTEAPTNKNGSIDLRTDAGRTLRAFGYLDDNGFPTDEAEAFLHVNKRTLKRQRSTPARAASRGR